MFLTLFYDTFHQFDEIAHTHARFILFVRFLRTLEPSIFFGGFLIFVQGEQVEQIS